MQKNYPKYKIIKDIGNINNFDNPGLIKILNYALNNKINKLIIMYKNRLPIGEGYKFIKQLIKKCSHGKIIIAK